MPISNYPNGFSNGVNINGVPLFMGRKKTGNVFWVDSTKGSDNNKGDLNHPFATIDYTVGRCTANNGDIIYVATGHVEHIVASGTLTIDVAGITIIFKGDGDDKAALSFETSTAAKVIISADNTTLVNPKFISAIDAIALGVSVTGANFSILNSEWHDAPAKAATVQIYATSAASNFLIDGWKFYPSTTGTQKNEAIVLFGNSNPVLRNIDISGDFLRAAIHASTAASTNLRLENIKIKNENVVPNPGILLHADTTGFAKNVDVRIVSGSTYVSSNAKMNWDIQCLGYSADGTGGDPIGTSGSGTIEAKIDTISTNIGDPSGDTLTSVVAKLGDGATTVTAALGTLNTDIGTLNTSIGDPSGDTLTSITAKLGDGATTVIDDLGTLKAGSVFVVQKTLISSNVVQAGVDVTGVSSGGDIIIEDIYMNTDATGLAVGTNFQLETDNTSGVSVFFAETVANLGANKTENIASGSVTSIAGIVLETGKKIIAKSTVADCTGAGTITLTIKLRRVVAGSTVSAA